MSSGSQKLAARWDVAFSADGLDQVGVEAVLAPRVGGDVEELVVVLVGPVGPAVAAKVVPEVLDAVEFRGVRRQRNERDVGRDVQVVGSVKAGSIPDHRGLHVGGECAGELIQELVDDRRVQAGCEDRLGLAGLRAGGTDHPEIFVLGLSHRRRSRATLGPHTSQRPLLTESALILKERDDLFAGVLGLNLREFFGNFF